jgi:uncharacterized protein (UPF0276 family)
VLLERDNNIPPLSELLDEIRRIDRVYQSAVARWRARSSAAAPILAATAGEVLGHA